MYFSDSYGEFNFYEVYFRGIHLTKNYELFIINLYNLKDYIDEVTDYYYDHSSGVLKLTVHALIPGAENVTENDLKVTIYVDVIVFKDDYGPK
jgi:hypothetical protein